MCAYSVVSMWTCVCCGNQRTDSLGASHLSLCLLLFTVANWPKSFWGVLTSHLYKGITDGITDACLLDGLWESEFRSHLATLYQSLISSVAMKWSGGSEGTMYY